MIEIICKQCGKHKKVKPYLIKRGGGKYCSIKCYSLARTKKIDKICEQCGKPFKARNTAVKKGFGKYCSRKCMGLSKRGENSPQWKGGYNVRRERTIKKLMKNPQWRLNMRIGNLIRKNLKRGSKNGKHWENLVPYNIKQLKRRLQSTMPIGYTWQDFLDGKLEIDHIRPVSSFNFTKPEGFEFQQCWALENLRLITKEENRKKHNKLIKSFQTNLEMEI